VALAIQAWKALVGSGKPIPAFLFKLYNPEHFDFMMPAGFSIFDGMRIVL